MSNNPNYEKTEDEKINNAIQLVNAAFENHENGNDEIFEFKCPVCKGQARAVLYMYNGSLHGAVECKNCGYIHI